MQLGTLEILATILIVFVVIKLVVFLISPQAWLQFARKLYIKPQITSGIAFLLAAVVLYFLHTAGISIIHILAVALFIALLVVIGMAKYADELLEWAMAQDIYAILKEQWFYTLIWVGLIVWGIQAIFFAA